LFVCLFGWLVDYRLLVISFIYQEQFRTVKHRVGRFKRRLDELILVCYIGRQYINTSVGQ
jgi:hypothetical protein